LSIFVVLILQFPSSALDICDLHWINGKFHNTVLQTSDTTKVTQSIWSVYDLQANTQSNKIIEESIVHKILQIFQNGIALLNTMDIDIMLKQMNVDSTKKNDNCFDHVEQKLNI
jgi:hypothetical protein